MSLLQEYARDFTPDIRKRGEAYQRERAVYLVSRALGWEFIPLTVIRDGPHGIGSMQLFVETARRFPKLDLALLPIGPIEPRSLMRIFHMDPYEAMQAFIDLDAQRMVPIHYDTFVNSTDRPGDALKALADARKRWSIGEREVVPVGVGEQ